MARHSSAMNLTPAAPLGTSPGIFWFWRLCSQYSRSGWKTLYVAAGSNIKNWPTFETAQAVFGGKTLIGSMKLDVVLGMFGVVRGQPRATRRGRGPVPRRARTSHDSPVDMYKRIYMCRRGRDPVQTRPAATPGRTR